VTRNQLVSNIDLAPTILQATGATAGRTVDGRSLLPLAADPGRELGRDLLIERGPGTPANVFTGLRTRNFFYAEYGNGDTELYDLRRDPFELQSRHADPAYAALRASFSRRLHALRACRGRGCSRGPRLVLGLRARIRGGCAPGSALASLGGGADLRHVQTMLLLVDGRPARSDRRRPFVKTLPRSRLRPGATTLTRTIRARVTLDDDRVVTLDRRLRVCGR
jgi:hypothetical protein